MAEERDSVHVDPDFPNGEWVGFYQDTGSNHRQEMHLTFGGGRINGAGADDVGPFTVSGGYDSDRREAWWTKTYLGSHSVFYKGFREVKGIWGMWEIPPRGRDGFHIWPRAFGAGETVATTQQQERPAGVPQTPVHGV